jgi:hypothetical protein
MVDVHSSNGWTDRDTFAPSARSAYKIKLATPAADIRHKAPYADWDLCFLLLVPPLGLAHKPPAQHLIDLGWQPPSAL